MALELKCRNCKHLKSRSVCGSSESPYFMKNVESDGCCEYYSENPAREYFKEGTIKSLSEESAGAGMEDLKKAIELGLPEDDEMFARFVLAEGHVNLVLAQRSRFTDDEVVTSHDYTEALNQAEKAILLDQQGDYGYFNEPLNRARLRVVDEFYSIAALVIEKKNGVDAAIDYLQKKVALLSYLPTSPLIRSSFSLGDLYEQKGQKGKAVEYYRNIVNSAPIDRIDPQGVEQELRRRAGIKLEGKGPGLSGMPKDAGKGGGSMRCFYHQDLESVGICQQCGKFCCRQCIHDVSGTMLCKGCLERAAQSQATQEAEERQNAVEESEQRRRQAVNRIRWAWVFAFFGAMLGLLPFLPSNSNQGLGIPAYVFVPLVAYELWGAYWGFAWFWPRWRSMVDRFKRALSGWIIFARPAAWFMIFFFYICFYIWVPTCVAIIYGVFGGGIIQYLKHRAVAASKQLPEGPGSAPVGQAAPAKRRGRMALVIGGTAVIGAILLAALYSGRRGTSPGPVQSSSPVQSVTPPPPKAQQHSPAQRASVPTHIAKAGVPPVNIGVVTTCAEAPRGRNFTPKYIFAPGQNLCLFAQALNVNRGRRDDVTFSAVVAGSAGTVLAAPPARFTNNRAPYPNVWHRWRLRLPPDLSPGQYVARISIRNNLTGQTGSGSAKFTLTSAANRALPLATGSETIRVERFATAHDSPALGGCGRSYETCMGALRGTIATEYAPTEEAVWFVFSYSGGEAGGRGAVEWITPNGSVYRANRFSNTQSGGNYCYCYFIKVAGFPPSNMPGQWHVRLMWDGNAVVRTSFTIR